MAALTHVAATHGATSTQHPDLKNNATEEEKELAFGQVWKEAGHKETASKGTQRPSLMERRKSSVQFATANAEETIRRESVAAGAKPHEVHPGEAKPAARDREKSPPPPMPYHRGIAFDTFATAEAGAEAFSIQYKHQDFQYTARTRTFIVGTDAKDYSEYALEWTLEELVDDGDEIVCLRVVGEDSTERRRYKEEADRLLDSVIAKNAVERKAISMKMELAVGKVTDVIQSMIQLYEPVAIIVGTRGRNLTGMQGLMPGSVSKYCLQRSPVPTIVVRPSSKRTKKKMKRRQEMGRSVYTSILSKAQSVRSNSVLDKAGKAGTLESRDAEKEASAVEKAIGSPPRKGILRNRHYGGPLARVTSVGSGDDDEDDEPARFALPIGYLSTESAPKADLAMKSPIIQALGEKWDDSPKNGSRTQSPAPGKEDEEDSWPEDGMPTIVDERRPSTRSQTPWLNDILRRPDPIPGRLQSRDRSARSRSR